VSGAAEKGAAAEAVASDRAADSVLGQNVIGGFRPSDLIGSAGVLAAQAMKQPLALAQASLGFFGELAKLAAGQSRLSPEPGDKRFGDAAWRENPFYAGLLQAYLAWRKSLTHYAKTAGLDPRESERAEFLLSQLGDALAPSNFLLGNPAAFRRFKETNGMSLARGARNLAGDVLRRRPIPSQVDESAFEVGGNLAATPGSVVLRTEMFELIQYAPQTEQVRQRPVLVCPSIVNKYYIFDLAPGRSILEYYVQKGLTVFVVVWRNPQPRHDRWGFRDYQDALDKAIGATCSVTGADSVNMWAVCGAGPVVASLAAYYRAVEERKINSLLFVVSPLDLQAMTQSPGVGAFVAKDDSQAEEALRKRLSGKRISAREFTLLFAMLRANELIWSYWVNNYLMGENPSAFDVLYWNGDATGMTAQFNHDFSQLVETNPLPKPGMMSVRGVPIVALDKLDIDSYVLGAANDHLCVWQGVYRSAKLLGSRSQFVLGNSGHVQTIVCPPGNAKASYFTNETLPETADEWLKTATKHQGSWWDHGVAWTIDHAGDLIDAPQRPGNNFYPLFCPAPGVYVHEHG
jgi:polyhydroxyalkanoate synthase subunit PhaC